MTWFRRIIRWLFAVVFLAGGIAHIVLGQVSPDIYAAFSVSAAFDWVEHLWVGVVMPNIGWLTILLGLFELAVGAGLLAGGRLTRGAVLAAYAFFAFLLLLGYAFPAESWVQDFLANRVFNLVMAALLLPVLWDPDPESLLPWRSRRNGT